MGSRRGASGWTRRSPRRRSTSSSGCSRHFGSLPSPEELRAAARREPGVHAPTSQMRALRELEPPAADEGFASVERVPFTRRPAGRAGAGVFVAAAALRQPDWKGAHEQHDPGAPHLVFDWSPDGTVEELADVTSLLADEASGPVESALCPHPAGPPTCWCRPPLPGLPLAFARKHAVDPSRSVLQNLARTSDARDLSRRPLRSGLGERLVQLDQAVDVRLYRELEARARDAAPNPDDVNRRQLSPEVVERREAHAEAALVDET